MKRLPLFVNPTSADHPWARVSFPFAKGEVRGDVRPLITGADHRAFPVQTWPLAYWPDGSLRILHAVAPLPGGRYEATFDGEPPPPSESLAIDWDTWFPSDSLCGQVRLALRVEWDDGAGDLEIEGPAKVIIDGPLYALYERWVRVARGDRFLRFRLRFEFFAGVPGVGLGVMLVNDCPGADFQTIRSIEVVLRGPGTRHALWQPCFGFEYLDSRFVETDQLLDVRLDDSDFRPYVANYDALNDPHSYPHYLRPPPDSVGGAFFLLGDEASLQFEVENFQLLRPKAVRLEGGTATLALWPDWAGPLLLQQGRRREIRLALRMCGPGLPVDYSAAQARSAALLDVHRCQLRAEVYAGARFFDMGRVLQHRPDLHPRFEGWLKALGTLHTPAEFFNLGDTPDGHYQSTYLPLGYCRPKKGRNPERPQIMIKSSGPQPQCFEGCSDYEPVWVNNEYDVLFCLGTESLRSTNLGMLRFLRHFARHTIEVDFLCYSDHPTLHRAQPAHSEFHTSTGAYPSHFWTQGLAQYYFLSGDDDALEVVRALADKTIWYFEHPRLGALHTGINREMGWAVLTLVSAYETTCDARYDTWARRLIDLTLAEPLPEDLPHFDFGMTSMMLGCREYIEAHRDDDTLTAPVRAWFLALLRLAVKCSTSPPEHAGTSTPKYSYDLDLLARGKAGAGQPRPGLLPGYAALDCLAYAHELTADPCWLDAGLRTLEAFLDGNPGYFHISTTQSSFRAPLAEGKPFAVAYRSFITYLGALHRAGKLADFDYLQPPPKTI